MAILEESQENVIISKDEKIKALEMENDRIREDIKTITIELLDRNIRDIDIELERLEKLAEKRIKIQFLCDNKINFLIEEAPTPPVLLYLNDQIFLRKGIVSELVGAGGVGKTHLLTQLALAVATGSKFLGTYAVEKPGYVFLALGENTNEDIHRLLRKVSKNLYSEEELKPASKYLAVKSLHGIQSSFMGKDGKCTDFFNKCLTELQEKEPEEGWTLIILDPISRFLGPEVEINNAAATQFIALLEQITRDLAGNPTVLFGHHMSKAAINSNEINQTAGRGSSAITDGVRFQLTLEKVKDKETLGRFQETERDFIRRLIVTKTNFTVMPKPQYLIVNKDGLLSNKEM